MALIAAHLNAGVILVATSAETTRLIRDGEKREREEGIEVGEEGDYIPFATLSPPE